MSNLERMNLFLTGLEAGWFKSLVPASGHGGGFYCGISGWSKNLRIPLVYPLSPQNIGPRLSLPAVNAGDAIELQWSPVVLEGHREEELVYAVCHWSLTSAGLLPSRRIFGMFL